MFQGHLFLACREAGTHRLVHVRIPRPAVVEDASRGVDHVAVPPTLTDPCHVAHEGGKSVDSAHPTHYGYGCEVGAKLVVSVTLEY